MRLHHLQVTAFGPFAETVHIDFASLADSGLFLLTGPTGAGKTSVLDAVCFGLYGEVPGDRGGVRALRSDHAEPDAEPRVVLELGVGSRVLRLSRTAAWDRPKRRGEGTRRVQASVVVEEQVDGSWLPVTTRLDEAGQLVGELLGMTSRQFTQVALLPQGRFQAFLRASSVERHAVLQRLFRTHRFDDVERWLAERRVRHGREVAAGHTRCTTVLDRLLEATGAALPESWTVHTPDGLGALVDCGELGDWLDDLLSRSERAARLDREVLESTSAGLNDLEKQHDSQSRQWRARQRGESARGDLADLAAGSADLEREAERLRDHEAALPLLPTTRRAEAAAAELARRRTRLVHVRDSVLSHFARTTAESAPSPSAPGAARGGQGGIPLDTQAVREAFGGPDPASALDRLHGAVERAHAVAVSWLPREQEVVQTRRELEAATTSSEHLRATVRALSRRRGELREELQGVRSRHAVVVPLAALLPRRQAELAQVRTALAAAREATGLASELAASRTREQELAAQVLDVREEWLDLRERRIEGMAGELATSLAVGCSCPVCGSVEHPRPATTAAPVTPSDEELLREQMETVGVHHQAAVEVRTGHEARWERLQEHHDGHDEAFWEARAERAHAEEQESASAESEVHSLTTRLEELTRLGHEVDVEQAETTSRAEAVAQSCRTLAGRVGDLAEEIDELLGGRHRSVGELVETLHDRERLLSEAVAAARARAAAEESVDQVSASLRDQLDAAGFDSLEDCLTAVLDEKSLDRMRSQESAARLTRARAEAVLGEDEVRAALEAPPLDPQESHEVLQRHRELRDLRLTTARRSAAVVQRAGELREELDAALDRWQPVRQAHALAARVAGLVEGTSPDNRLRMRLSGYVLSERLRQVVAAANHRLGTMTNQRFALEHVEEKGAGEQRGGLSLRMRDGWSGTTRDPATLSGGESFVVSLALALGLADTVAQEAGGTEVETLFVDEGFGSLDAETLDAVMDVLDGLREGGRVVGLVSHVAELRARIGAQLQVRKTSSGSTVHATLGGTRS